MEQDVDIAHSQPTAPPRRRAPPSVSEGAQLHRLVLRKNSLAQHWARDWRALSLTQVHHVAACRPPSVCLFSFFRRVHPSATIREDRRRLLASATSEILRPSGASGASSSSSVPSVHFHRRQHGHRLGYSLLDALRSHASVPAHKSARDKRILQIQLREEKGILPLIQPNSINLSPASCHPPRSRIHLLGCPHAGGESRVIAVDMAGHWERLFWTPLLAECSRRTCEPDGFHFSLRSCTMECKILVLLPSQAVTPLSPGRGGASAGAAGVRDVCGPESDMP